MTGADSGADDFTEYLGGPMDGGSVYSDRKLPTTIYTPRMPPLSGGVEPKRFPRPGLAIYERQGNRHVFKGWVKD